MLGRCFYWVFILLGLLLTAACSRPSSQNAGYIEGRYTYIATSVSGRLTQLLVERGAWVKKGQPLFALEEEPESDLYHSAEENLKQATAARDAVTANLEYAKLTYERNQILVPKKAIQQSELDNAKSIYGALVAQLAQANATIAQATATLAQAKWTLQQKMLYAPVDGSVFDTYYRLGEYTEANKAILSLLAPADIKAIFFVSEKILGSIHVKDEVSVQCDGCVSPYRARISFISPSAEYTPPVIYSTETNEKLVYRIEAEFTANAAVQLHPGQPVTVTVYPHGK